MKRLKFITALMVTAALLSCGGNADAENLNDLQNNDEIEDTKSCDKNSVDDWKNFVGIEYGTNELELEGIIGEFTGGEYTADSSAFIYYFKRVERAPLTVWVNGKSGKVETIFMEVLGYEEVFKQDVADATAEFDMKECDTQFFGMTPEEVINLMGKPAADKEKEDGVRSISYDSDDFKVSVNFKFYESQGGVCSSISLNWFY
jgi:hypothetical protein